MDDLFKQMCRIAYTGYMPQDRLNKMLEETPKEKTMKIIKRFEKFRNNELQVIELSCEVKNRKQINDLGYDDFKADLYINHNLITDISHVLSDAGVFTEMIDAEDWEAMYEEQHGGFMAIK